MPSSGHPAAGPLPAGLFPLAVRPCGGGLRHGGAASQDSFGFGVPKPGCGNRRRADGDPWWMESAWEKEENRWPAASEKAARRRSTNVQSGPHPMGDWLALLPVLVALAGL